MENERLRYNITITFIDDGAKTDANELRRKLKELLQEEKNVQITVNSQDTNEQLF